MGVLKIAGGILLAVFILIVIGIAILAAVDYQMTKEAENTQKLKFDYDNDSKLNATENARYVADKEGMDPESHVFYIEHGCFFHGYNDSYTCPAGTPDYEEPTITSLPPASECTNSGPGGTVECHAVNQDYYFDWSPLAHNSGTHPLNCYLESDGKGIEEIVYATELRRLY